MKSQVDHHIKAIEAIERSDNVKKATPIIAIVIIIALVFLLRPDIPRAVYDNSVDAFMDLKSRVRQEEVEEEKAPVVKEETVEEVKKESGTILEKSIPITVRGNTIMLTMVNTKGTFCRIKINDDIMLFTNETEKSVSGMKIRVLEAIPSPETCEVVIK